LQTNVPVLDEARRTAQQAVNAEQAKQADLSARLEALKALQEKVQTDDKLKPWLAKHGLDGLQALWSRIHIEAGWENALEAALRERMASLEVSRLDIVRAFQTDVPPTKLAFYTAPSAAAPDAQSALPKLSDLLRLNDAGQKALLTDWLNGCFTAPNLDEALAKGVLKPVKATKPVKAAAPKVEAPKADADDDLDDDLDEKPAAPVKKAAPAKKAAEPKPDAEVADKSEAPAKKAPAKKAVAKKPAAD
jgi:hypothetical protein